MLHELSPDQLREYERVGVDRRRAMQLFTAHLLQNAPSGFDTRGPLVVHVADDILMRTLASLPDQAGTELFVEALIKEAT